MFVLGYDCSAFFATSAELRSFHAQTPESSVFFRQFWLDSSLQKSSMYRFELYFGVFISFSNASVVSPDPEVGLACESLEPHLAPPEINSVRGALTYSAVLRKS